MNIYRGAERDALMRCLSSASKKETPESKSPLYQMFSPSGEHHVDLICKMLNFDHEERISALEALQHPYFNDIYNPDDIIECDYQFDEELECSIIDSMGAKKLCYDLLVDFCKRPR
ncbi:mitogen-activated protein kinase [Acrasis kona]|uniref:Mitogen-activated protein kinase n=1 Tax=Acrasis kona TaxID=1008807 RepID=A0AAW2ZA90_9EUKA